MGRRQETEGSQEFIPLTIAQTQEEDSPKLGGIPTVGMSRAHMRAMGELLQQQIVEE